MVVGRDYMLKKSSGPSASKFFFDTQIVPLAVNTAGAAEVALARLSARTGVRPAVISAGVVGLTLLAVHRLWRVQAENRDVGS